MIADQEVITEAPGEPSVAQSSDLAISVRNVSKMYRIYDRPQDRLKQMLWRGRRLYGREFWALRDVSFEVRRGETVGIIGRNGSGKSTLLQIIAGTLTPTEGEVRVNGRVAALLELGSGFNPEFTGRENVYMNGAILGLSREEMAQRFDDIAAFADIGEFIDQPVKLYSSGMLLRLAFAVQVHVDADILIVDEALSVGDVFFQAKCMAQMKRLLEKGITVLFVSHDAGAVKSLCRRAILLNKGEMIDEGSAQKITEHYFALKVQSEQPVLETVSTNRQGHTAREPRNDSDAALLNTSAFEQRATFQRIQNGKARFLNVQLLNHDGNELSLVEYEQFVTLRMAVEVLEDIPEQLTFGYHIRDQNGVDIVYSDSYIEDTSIWKPRKGEKYLIDWSFRASLRHGLYNISTVLSIPVDVSRALVDFCDFVPLAAQFEMAARRQSYLYGSVHWDNKVQFYLAHS